MSCRQVENWEVCGCVMARIRDKKLCRQRKPGKSSLKSCIWCSGKEEGGWGSREHQFSFLGARERQGRAKEGYRGQGQRFLMSGPVITREEGGCGQRDQTLMYRAMGAKRRSKWGGGECEGDKQRLEVALLLMQIELCIFWQRKKTFQGKTKGSMRFRGRGIGTREKGREPIG